MSSLFNIESVDDGYQETITLTEAMKASKHLIKYTCSSSGQNGLIMLYCYNTGNECASYMLPVQFLGEVSYNIEIDQDVNTIQLVSKLNGASISNFSIETADDPYLEYVKTQSAYWDRILEITNNTGMLRAEALEGLLNLTNTAFANSSGTVTVEDGVMTFLNTSSKDTATMAVQITGGAIRISNNKDAEGNWIWSTAMNGGGIVADTIVSGVLRSIDITGVNITGSTITGGTVNGVVMNGGTIYAGDKAAGNYIEISPNNPIKVWRNGYIVSQLGYTDKGAGRVTINQWDGKECFALSIADNGNARIDVDSAPGYTWDSTQNKWIENTDVRKLIIKGGQVIIDNTLKVGSEDDNYLVANAADVRILEESIQLLRNDVTINKQLTDAALSMKANVGHKHSCSIDKDNTWGHSHTIM